MIRLRNVRYKNQHGRYTKIAVKAWYKKVRVTPRRSDNVPQYILT